MNRRFLLYSLLVFFLLKPLLAHSRFDLAAGSGFLWAGVSQSSTFLSDTVERKTTENILMRETAFLALRYSSYEPKDDGFWVIGMEVSGTLAHPTISGRQKFVNKDSSGKQIADYTENLTVASAPAFNSLRGSMHLGYYWPLTENLGTEWGILAGVSAGTAKSDYQYSFSGSSGGGTGPAGIGVHIALRGLLTYYVAKSVALSLEYRLMAEVFGSFTFLPILFTSSSLLDNSGHLFLLSVGYHYGTDSAVPKDSVASRHNDGT